jgi:hypothetical protein
MKPIARSTVLAPGDDALDALRILGDGEIGQASVVEHGRITGLVRREDILRWFDLHRRTSGAA